MCISMCSYLVVNFLIESTAVRGTFYSKVFETYSCLSHNPSFIYLVQEVITGQMPTNQLESCLSNMSTKRSEVDLVAKSLIFKVGYIICL